MPSQPANAAAMTLEGDGAALLSGAALSILLELDILAERANSNRAGVRLHGNPQLRDLAGPRGPLIAIAQRYLGAAARAVRAIVFDKSPAMNWALGWHQDRTIAVAAKHVCDGYEIWTSKAGICHVEPPFPLIERMVTLRVHLDDVDDANAPLLIAPGSHRLGRIPEANITGIVERCGSYACHARRGDVWVYSTPILHASARSRASRARRVLQLDYSADALPPPLEWLGL